MSQSPVNLTGPPSRADRHPPGAPARPVDALCLAAICHNAIHVDKLIQLVGDDSAGGTSIFLGRVRNHDHQRSVLELDYTAHPSALPKLRDICHHVAARHDVLALAAVHRIGRLRIGDVAVAVAASSIHRGESFNAAKDLIDTIKAEVPIWKLQRYADGADVWVGAQ